MKGENTYTKHARNRHDTHLRNHYKHYCKMLSRVIKVEKLSVFKKSFKFCKNNVGYN